MEINRAKVLAQRRIKLKLSEYHPKEQYISSRIAEFLNWGAEKYPRSVFTYEEITQAIFTLGSLPKVGSKQVQNIRNAVSRARIIMRDKFKRDIVTIKGVGARATVDSADTLTTSVVREVASHERSCKKLKETVALINNKELQDLIEKAPADLKEDLRTLGDWYSDVLMRYVKRLEQPQAMQALLPPPPALTGNNP